jgi:ribosomal protein L29
MTSEEIEDEEKWLRRRVMRLRTIMRFALDARVKTVLREFITEAEERLDKLGKSPLPRTRSHAERER